MEVGAAAMPTPTSARPPAPPATASLITAARSTSKIPAAHGRACSRSCRALEGYGLKAAAGFTTKPARLALERRVPELHCRLGAIQLTAPPAGYVRQHATAIAPAIVHGILAPI